jgi:hypothetical protein
LVLRFWVVEYFVFSWWVFCCVFSQLAYLSSYLCFVFCFSLLLLLMLLFQILVLCVVFGVVLCGFDLAWFFLYMFFQFAVFFILP